eukprot:CAMPEP_0179003696 /NCGR_PEP_ID=MMETSP0795-20121207/12851_1 /TAXON_ID=88552 /ORGANISM="Amoebophrya sp., Strain Ameob2" /LENGTH=123 /DNA_ID=CAMNT_0020697793 /DNA_START=423 /DNA_END=795 /DNA_ORIENTATION=+
MFALDSGSDSPVQHRDQTLAVSTISNASNDRVPTTSCEPMSSPPRADDGTSRSGSTYREQVPVIHMHVAAAGTGVAAGGSSHGRARVEDGEGERDTVAAMEAYTLDGVRCHVFGLRGEIKCYD